MKHLERDEIYIYAYQKFLSLISYANTFVPLEIYDRIT